MQKLKIEMKEGLGFVPPLIGYLGSIAEYSYGYRFYKLRHPGGIFNYQLGDVASNLLDLVKYVNSLEVKFADENRNNKELIKKLTATLFSFNNYFNSAYDIILGCCKNESEIPTRYVRTWLKEKGYTAGQIYYKELAELKPFLNLFNELKHSSNRFGTVALIRQRDNAQIHGYYLESVDDNGALIPNKKFHPENNGEHTSNSFNLDLRKLYYGIYKIADSLLLALLDHFKNVWEVEFSFNEGREENDSLLQELFQNVDQVSLNFLPNEWGQEVPIARLVNKDHSLVFESHRVAIIKGPHVVMANLTPGDGFSRSWGLPYYKPPTETGK